ncbi:MAG: hypothetical protein QF444_02170 [Phycisphaerales bacterium]|jgi:hypothetical protein|nr:hypothetical protein [Phycisphaerales bacterium]
MTLLLNTLLGFTISMTILGSNALAQEPTEDLLAGPTVQDQEVTHEDMRAERSRVTGKGDKNHQNRDQLRLWMTTIRSVDLTKKQQEEISSLVHQLRNAQEKFQKEHGKEIRELKKKSKEAKKNGNDIPDDVGTRTRELIAIAPDPAEYQSKAWVLLSEDQQTTFKKNYQEAIDKLLKKRDMKNKSDSPMMDEETKRQDHRKRDFDNDDQQIRDKQNHRDDREFDGDSVDEAGIRRVRFLRRLQRLRDESPSDKQ